MNNDTRNVFFNRNYRLVFFGALVSELGAILYSFAVSFYILEITDNNAFLQGLYLALCGGMLLLATPVGGVLGDRFNKAKIMFLCDYMKGGIIVLATVLMLLFRSSDAHVLILFAVGILGNAVSGVFSPAAGALLPHIVAEEKLQQANAYFSIKSSLQSILGVVLAGILYATLPIHLLFFLVGVCYLLSGVSEMFIRYDHKPSEEKLTIRLALADMGDGFRYLKTQKALMALMAAILFINFFFSPIGGNFLPYFVKTDVAAAPSYLFDRVLTPELWSSVCSVMIGISSLLAAAILSARPQEDKCGRKVAVRLGYIAMVMILLTVGYWLLVDRGLSLNGFLVLLCVGSLLIGFLVVMINVPTSTVLMRVVDRDKLSKVSSIVSIVSQGLTPISSVLAGSVLQYLGSTPLLLVCSLGFTATALFLLFNKQVRNI
jgi:Major Facilitator Superfamily.